MAGETYDESFKPALDLILLHHRSSGQGEAALA